MGEDRTWVNSCRVATIRKYPGEVCERELLGIRGRNRNICLSNCYLLMKFWQVLDVEGAIHLFGRRQTLLSIEQCPDLGRDQESLKKGREVLWGCLENYFLVTDMVMQVKEYVIPSCHH